MDHSERVQGYILRHSAVKIPTDLEKKSTVQNLLCYECYQRRNIVEGETRNSAIETDIDD